MSILCPPEHSPILQLLKYFQYGNLWDQRMSLHAEDHGFPETSVVQVL